MVWIFSKKYTNHDKLIDMGTPHPNQDTINTTLSDYMITLFQYRHSGMDSPQAILPDAHRVNANLFLTDLCRNPGTMDGFDLAIRGTGYPLSCGYGELTHINLTL
jgi:hypothetical protein